MDISENGSIEFLAAAQGDGWSAEEGAYIRTFGDREPNSVFLNRAELVALARAIRMEYDRAIVDEMHQRIAQNFAVDFSDAEDTSGHNPRAAGRASGMTYVLQALGLYDDSKVR